MVLLIAMGAETLQDYLRQAQVPQLNRAVALVQDSMGDKDVFPQSTNFRGLERVRVMNKVISASVPVAVLNAVLALGIDPKAGVDEMTLRLAAADIGTERRGDWRLLEQVPEIGLWFTTRQGLGQLMKIVKAPTRSEPLPIEAFEESASDIGLAHEALMNGCTAVAVHNTENHALTLAGASQKEGIPTWYVVPPDEFTFLFVTERVGNWVRGDLKRVTAPIVEVSPYELLGYLQEFWLVKREDNLWAPSVDTEEPPLDLGEIKLV
ncbi:MAG: hypothetical protein JW991_00275 [Candidatus Pacebacteria bacterium]|nr:hypothetical protein [Candidatus Paceibacterota bacterium]